MACGVGALLSSDHFHTLPSLKEAEARFGSGNNMSDEACDVSEVDYGARMTASWSFVQLSLVENVAYE